MSNHKDKYASEKPLKLDPASIPGSALYGMMEGFRYGRSKYGAYDLWKKDTDDETYWQHWSSARRHLDAIKYGTPENGYKPEWIDPESGVSHAYLAMCQLAILSELSRLRDSGKKDYEMTCKQSIDRANSAIDCLIQACLKRRGC